MAEKAEKAEAMTCGGIVTVGPVDFMVKELSAAAELRRKKVSDEGFKRLENLPYELGESPQGGGRSKLFGDP